MNKHYESAFIKKLDENFYLRDNVVQIAKELLGKIIVTTFDGNITSARIVETEAYSGITDKASHAYGGRRTKRTEVMYAKGGTAYVYLCYGIHHLFNVVTNIVNIPHAVLIRGAEPITGIEYMLERSGKLKADYSLTKGPGNVSKSLGISTKHTNISLLEHDIFIVDNENIIDERLIAASSRIGVNYAGNDALLPYRFYLKNNFYVSGKTNFVK